MPGRVGPGDGPARTLGPPASIRTYAIAERQSRAPGVMSQIYAREDAVGRTRSKNALHATSGGRLAPAATGRGKGPGSVGLLGPAQAPLRVPIRRVVAIRAPAPACKSPHVSESGPVSTSRIGRIPSGSQSCPVAGTVFKTAERSSGSLVRSTRTGSRHGHPCGRCRGSAGWWPANRAREPDRPRCCSFSRPSPPAPFRAASDYRSARRAGGTPARAPNGNDYGKDLLRQHDQRHPHSE